MKRKTKKGGISVDFTGIEAGGGGGGRLLPEGPIKLELTEIEEKEGEESGKPYLQLAFEVPDGEEFAGTKAWDNMSLQPQALWKLRGFLEAAGVETVDGPMDIDTDELIGVVVTANIIHEDYKGKMKHRIDGYLDDSEGTEEGEEEQEEKPARSAGARRKPAKQEEPEDDGEEGWAVKDKVKFKDGKKTLTGTITAIDDDTITVKVGTDEYEVGPDDLTAA